MSLSILDGPGGLDCKHVFNGGTFTLNDLESGLPRAVLDRRNGITGLFDSADTGDKREERTAQIGESTYPTFERGKTVVYKGELEAADQEDLAGLRQSMRAAFRAAVSTERSFEIQPHADFGDHHWAYYARVLSGGLQIEEDVYRKTSHVRGVFARQFRLSVRMSDPRFILFTGYVDSPGHASAAIITVNNPGDAEADPLFTVTVPAGTPDILIENLDVVTASGTARLRFNDVPAGELVVNFQQGGRFARLDGVDAMRYFDSAYSNWWDELIPGINPGDNDVKVTGGGWGVEFWPRCI